MAKRLDPGRWLGRNETLSDEDLFVLFDRPRALLGLLREADAEEYLAVITYLLIRENARDKWRR